MSTSCCWINSAVALAVFGGIAIVYAQRRDCDFVALKRQADLETSAVCVITRDCQVLECGLSVDEESKLLEKNNESYLFWVEPLRHRRRENVIRKSELLWEPSMHITIKNYAKAKFEILTDSGTIGLVLPYRIGQDLGFEKTRAEYLFQTFGWNSAALSIQGYARAIDIEIDGQRYENMYALWCDKNYDTDKLLIGRADRLGFITLLTDEIQNLVEYSMVTITKQKTLVQG